MKADPEVSSSCQCGLGLDVALALRSSSICRPRPNYGITLAQLDHSETTSLQPSLVSATRTRDDPCNPATLSCLLMQQFAFYRPGVQRPGVSLRPLGHAGASRVQRGSCPMVSAA